MKPIRVLLLSAIVLLAGFFAPARGAGTVVWKRSGKEIRSNPASATWGSYHEPLPRRVIEDQKERDKAFRAAFAEWKKANEDRVLLLQKQ